MNKTLEKAENLPLIILTNMFALLTIGRILVLIVRDDVSSLFVDPTIVVQGAGLLACAYFWGLSEPRSIAKYYLLLAWMFSTAILCAWIIDNTNLSHMLFDIPVNAWLSTVAATSFVAMGMYLVTGISIFEAAKKIWR